MTVKKEKAGLSRAASASATRRINRPHRLELQSASASVKEVSSDAASECQGGRGRQAGVERRSLGEAGPAGAAGKEGARGCRCCSSFSAAAVPWRRRAAARRGRGGGAARPRKVGGGGGGGGGGRHPRAAAAGAESGVGDRRRCRRCCWQSRRARHAVHIYDVARPVLSVYHRESAAARLLWPSRGRVTIVVDFLLPSDSVVDTHTHTHCDLLLFLAALLLLPLSCVVAAARTRV